MALAQGLPLDPRADPGGTALGLSDHRHRSPAGLGAVTEGGGEELGRWSRRGLLRHTRFHWAFGGRHIDLPSLGWQAIQVDVHPAHGGAVEQVKRQRCALEPQDSGGNPDHQPAGIHGASATNNPKGFQRNNSELL